MYGGVTMKKVKKVVMLLSVGCSLALLAAGCNSSMSARAYQGEAQPLEEVAVLLSNPHTCPVFTIDGMYKDLNRKPGTEIHVLPGTHEVEVFYQAEGNWISPFEIKKTTLTQNFQAGRVYAIWKTEQQPEDLDMYQTMAWTPNIQEISDVVTYAAQNPKYHVNSKEWKTLRRENGLTKSFFEFFKFAKDKSDKQVQSH
jgi:hypothetical protein